MKVLLISTLWALCPLGSSAVPEEARETFDRGEALAWQAALEAKGFSPGLIDGLPGARTARATMAFQALRGLPATGHVDSATAEGLEIAAFPGITMHGITAADEKDVRYCPPDWNEKARRERLLYPTLSNLLAEKYHTSERCLSALNPGVDLASLRVGQTIRVPLLRKREPLLRRLHHLEIDLERKVILLLDASGSTLGLLHCSVARDLATAVRGDCVISSTVVEPAYTFDPEKWPEVKSVEKKLTIPPGPRSPVGLRWIGLDHPGVGIHGSPEPENIGKTGSHGCFRLTNWDAVFLASIVSVGTKVKVIDTRMEDLTAVR